MKKKQWNCSNIIETTPPSAIAYDGSFLWIGNINGIVTLWDEKVKLITKIILKCKAKKSIREYPQPMKKSVTGFLKLPEKSRWLVSGEDGTMIYLKIE